VCRAQSSFRKQIKQTFKTNLKTSNWTVFYIYPVLTLGSPVTWTAVRAQRPGAKVPVAVVGWLFQIDELGDLWLLFIRGPRRPGWSEPEPQSSWRSFARSPLRITTAYNWCHPCGRLDATCFPILSHKSLADFPEVWQTVPTCLHRTTPGHPVTLTVSVQKHLDDLRTSNMTADRVNILFIIHYPRIWS